MTFTNEFPKKEVTIAREVSVGSLIHNDLATIHYRDYKGYLDSIQYIILEGSQNAWFEVKADFLYDTLMGTVKGAYSDSFGRELKVTIINNK